VKAKHCPQAQMLFLDIDLLVSLGLCPCVEIFSLGCQGYIVTQATTGTNSDNDYTKKSPSNHFSYCGRREPLQKYNKHSTTRTFLGIEFFDARVFVHLGMATKWKGFSYKLP